MLRAGPAALMLLSLAACHDNTRAIVAEPSEISLKRALAETVEALYAARAAAMERRQQGDPAIGLNVCTVQAVFNVAASASNTRSAGGSLGTGPALPGSLTLNLSNQQVDSASRGNTVTVLFTTPACNPEHTLGTEKPDKVDMLQYQIEKARS